MQMLGHSKNRMHFLDDCKKSIIDLIVSPSIVGSDNVNLNIMSKKKKGAHLDNESSDEFKMNILWFIKLYGKGKYVKEKIIPLVVISLIFALLFFVAYLVIHKKQMGCS